MALVGGVKDSRTAGQQDRHTALPCQLVILKIRSSKWDVENAEAQLFSGHEFPFCRSQNSYIPWYFKFFLALLRVASLTEVDEARE